MKDQKLFYIFQRLCFWCAYCCFFSAEANEKKAKEDQPLDALGSHNYSRI
jgi:hypothetical protein